MNGGRVVAIDRLSARRRRVPAHLGSRAHLAPLPCDGVATRPMPRPLLERREPGRASAIDRSRTEPRRATAAPKFAPESERLQIGRADAPPVPSWNSCATPFPIPAPRLPLTIVLVAILMPSPLDHGVPRRETWSAPARSGTREFTACFARDLLERARVLVGVWPPSRRDDGRGMVAGRPRAPAPSCLRT